MTTKNLLNFGLFQLFWFAAVVGAGSGHLWLGPFAVAVFLGLHLMMVPAGVERLRELGYVLAVGLAGSLVDSGLHAIGATVYPTSREAWPFVVVPPWIASLWVAFAMLPRFSLGWLAGRRRLAVLFGAIGGPASYFAGTRFGAVAVGDVPLLTWGALAVEYAILMPIMLRLAPGASPKHETEAQLAESMEKSKRGAPKRVLRLVVLVALLVFGGGYVATRLLVAQAESAYPRAGRDILVGGLRQNVISYGAGPPIVFVHGAFGASQDFVETVIPELSSRYRCIAWDRPGHGYSERPEEIADPGVQADLLLELIRVLELEQPPLLVGFSFGGAVTLAAGLRDADALRGIVLLNGPSHQWPDPLDFHYELPAVPVLGPIVVETILMPFGVLSIPSTAERVFSPLPVVEAFERSPVSLSLRPANYRANAEDIRSLKPFLRAQSEHYGKLDLPLTIIVAEEDLVVSPTIHSPALHAAAPRSSMIRIPGAGHQILYTHPEIVIEAIDAAMD